MSIRGIDIASYQGTPDFAAVRAAGFDFVVDKVSQGLTYVNPRFAQTWPQIKPAGLLRGCYHYAEPDANEPIAEAEHFLATLGRLDAGDVLALDIEEGTGDISAWCLTWLRTVEAATSCKPLLYSGLWFMEPHGLLTAELAQSGLWLAAYQATLPAAPAPWEFVAIWQQSGSGTVPGIAGNVDLDVYEGDRASFVRYGVPAAPMPPPKPAPTNNDIVACLRYLTAEPPDMAALIAYAEQFT